MESFKRNVMVVLMMVVVITHGGKWVQAQVHHVVGDDRGWELGSDIASWVQGRTFVAGDFLWFAYSSGLDKDNVVELGSKEEFESCDVHNPIKMYTDGIDKISLEQEGFRYFTSSNLESCKKGLKLPVDIKSKSMAQIEALQSSSVTTKAFLAQEPTAPSSSTRICGSLMLALAAIVFTHVI